jgi:hypothetical protein
VYVFGIKTIELVTNHFLAQKEILDAGNVWDNLPPRQHVALVAPRVSLDSANCWMLPNLSCLTYKAVKRRVVAHCITLFIIWSGYLGPKPCKFPPLVNIMDQSWDTPELDIEHAWFPNLNFWSAAIPLNLPRNAVYPQIAIWTCRAPYFGPTNLSSDWLMGIPSFWMFMDYSDSNLEYTR